MNEFVVFGMVGLDMLDFGVMVIECIMCVKYVNVWVCMMMMGDDCLLFDGGLLYLVDYMYDVVLCNFIE